MPDAGMGAFSIDGTDEPNASAYESAQSDMSASGKYLFIFVLMLFSGVRTASKKEVKMYKKQIHVLPFDGVSGV